jgi:hypothetical protein
MRAFGRLFAAPKSIYRPLAIGQFIGISTVGGFPRLASKLYARAMN